ncbi:helix-turn-helix domain-containing protein [Agarivorans albus]
MITTLDLLEGLKARRALTSDYQAAKYLGVTHQSVSKWRNGQSMSEELAFKIADELGLDAEIVAFSLLLEKAKSERLKGILKRHVA